MDKLKKTDVPYVFESKIGKSFRTAGSAIVIPRKELRLQSALGIYDPKLIGTFCLSRQGLPPCFF